jgi:hypothetical protein
MGMERFQLWEGKEGQRTVRRMIHAEAILEDEGPKNDPEANARIFFHLDTQNLRYIGDVQITMEGGESTRRALGLCWLQEDYLRRGSAQQRPFHGESGDES